MRRIEELEAPEDLDLPVLAISGDPQAVEIDGQGFLVTKLWRRDLGDEALLHDSGRIVLTAGVMLSR